MKLLRWQLDSVVILNLPKYTAWQLLTSNMLTSKGFGSLIWLASDLTKGPSQCLKATGLAHGFRQPLCVWRPEWESEFEPLILDPWNLAWNQRTSFIVQSQGETPSLKLARQATAYRKPRTLVSNNTSRSRQKWRARPFTYLGSDYNFDAE